jgi:hypothetical protein
MLVYVLAASVVDHHFAGSGSITFLKKVIRIRPIPVDYF